MRQGIAAHLLQRVGHRVARVQHRTAARFALVVADHLGLDLDAPLHEVRERDGTALQEPRRLPLHPLEVRGVRDHAVLHGLGESHPVLALGEVGEHPGVGHHRLGGVEGADEVLPARRVHADLPPHRCVQHREQGGRHLDERDAPQVGGGDEAGEVAHHAAPDRDDGGIPPESAVEQRVGEDAPPFPGLGGLARGEDEAALAEVGTPPGAEARGHVLVGHQGEATAGHAPGHHLVQAAQRARLDQDRVGAARMPDGDRGHRATR